MCQALSLALERIKWAQILPLPEYSQGEGVDTEAEPLRTQPWSPLLSGTHQACGWLAQGFFDPQ